MKTTFLLLPLTLAVACQTAPPGDMPAAGASGGSTTYTRGTPQVTGSDTTRPAGQQPGAGGATLTLDRTSYARGATVTMRITSQSRDTLGYNQCSSRTVERQEGQRWVAHAEPDRMCTMELRLLMPGETQTATTDLPSDLRAGIHRIVLTLNPQSATGGSAIRAVSPTFTVN